MWARLFASRFYPWLLRAPRQSDLVRRAADPWTGNADRANAIFQGRYRFAHSEVQVFNKAPWLVEPPSTEWAAEAAAFGWLRDFRADGGQAAAKGARELVRSWLDGCGEWQPLAWRPDIIGRRMLAWCSHADFLLRGADPAFRFAFLTSLARQGKHLSVAWPMAPAGAGTLAALAGLATVHACMGWQGRTARALPGLLEAELRAQVLGDGCHVSRNPSDHLEVLRTLLWLRAALAAAESPVPLALVSAIEHMGPMLGLFRHGDGALALFHGSSEEDRDLVTETLAALPGKPRPRSTASHGHYERMSAGPSLALIDTGAPPPDPFAARAHAGSLAMEFSIGRERLIVNVGHREGQWRDASRATASHSTLTLADSNSSQVRPEGLGQRPRQVTTSRQEDDGALWLDAKHDGYLDKFGLFHRRRAYMSADGTTLRGEDIVEGPGVSVPKPDFALRFHLHPDVRASLTADGALLRLPGGSGWRFRAAGGELALDESVYLGRAGEIRRAEQIVLTGRVDADGSTIKWAFARIEV
ncbi:MAG: heparinase II/III family protein [Proteobacteria bacterium]|nr:heparinase II/III family protein [Pseudomonadota bacterium]